MSFRRSDFCIAFARPICAPTVSNEAVGSADLLGPRSGFAVGDADHNDLIIRRQRQFRIDGIEPRRRKNLTVSDDSVARHSETRPPIAKPPSRMLSLAGLLTFGSASGNVTVS